MSGRVPGTSRRFVETKVTKESPLMQRAVEQCCSRGQGRTMVRRLLGQ